MDPTRNRILIVDDEKVNISILVELLKEEYDTLVAKNGEQAIKRACSEHRPDLILLDVVMPDMDGYQVCRTLKKKPETLDIPIVFITAKDGETDEAEGLNCGAIDYITKPFSGPIIKARIRNHLELKRRGDLLKKLSVMDPLTGIANRRRFDEYLDQQWQLAKRDTSPLSLLIADIDYFKKYNDHYGHQAGDECLIKVTQVMQKGVTRTTDLLARYGGEEFVLILPLTDLDGTKNVAAKMLTNIRNAAIPHADSDVADIVTLSIGVATVYPDESRTLLDLINEADKLLYQAKDQGRNRFFLGELERCVAL